MKRQSDIIKPYCLKKGDGIGIFTPSWPAHVILRDKYQLSLHQLKALGFAVIEGELSRLSHAEGYRSASGKERAKEFMDLIHNPEVQCLLATIGGSNSSSMIPYLDFSAIRDSRKIICGYSDITSLQLAILAYSGLSTIYGPTLVPIFGEEKPFPYAVDSFLKACMGKEKYPLNILPPELYSDHFIDASKSNWKDIDRKWKKNEGWRILSPGKAQARVLIANLETLMTASGTSYFPDLEGKILVIEEMDAYYSKEERNLRHLELMGVFNEIAGLIISKPSFEDNQGAPFSHDDLIQEVVGPRSYPIVSNFDAGHTFPMISMALDQEVLLIAEDPKNIQFALLEPAVAF